MGERQAREERARLKREREKVELRKGLRRRRRRTVWSCAAIVALGAATAVAATLVSQSISTKVTGRLEGLGQVAFVEGTQDFGGMSPVCGCEHPPVDAWRGITFAARAVRLNRRGGLGWTQWIISAAEPHALTPRGTQQRLRVVAVRFDPDGKFDPRWMIMDELDNHGEILAEDSFRGAAFSLYNHHDLRLAMLGQVPVGAWVPFPGSRVTLESPRSEFFSPERKARITEHYPSSIGVRQRSDRKGLWATSSQYYPLGDFLGPNLVLWTEDPHARIYGTALSHPTRKGVITAFLIGDSNFSTRVAAAPAERLDLTETAEYAAERPRKAREELYSRDLPGGTIAVTVEKTLGQRQYKKLQERAQADPYAWVRIKLPPKELDLSKGRFGLPPGVVAARVVREKSQRQRYPPLPHFAGLNVFGPLKKVSFTGVHGRFLVEDKLVDLGGSADVGLNDVKGLHDESGHQLISTPLATAAGTANLQFVAHGQVTVNGVAQATVGWRYRDWLVAAGILLSILATSFGVFGVIRSLRKEA
jgi:hypothetical protein